MRYVALEELRNSILNRRFLLGISLVILAALFSEWEMLKKIVELGGSSEGPGWSVAFSYFTNSKNLSLFIPIAVCFAAGESVENELKSRFSIFYIIRTDKRKYCVGKVIGLCMSGGLIISLASLFLLFVSVIGFERFPSLSTTEFKTVTLIGQAGTSLVRMFMNGSFWALVGGSAAVVTRNKYMAYAVPFILYYVLTTFQERYYQKLFFLSPRYWMAPIYYGNAFCIGILLMMNFLATFFLIYSIRRRLKYA